MSELSFSSTNVQKEDFRNESAPRRGSTLEGRVRSLLQAKGYRAQVNKILLDNEIDVYGINDEGQVVLVECKEYYNSGPVSPSQIRNFFGKVYDIEHNFGENVFAKMFVSISGFTDAARSLCDRLGILAINNESLDLMEQSRDDIVPHQTALEDQSILELRRLRDKLQEEVSRRTLVRKLGQQVDDLNRIVETKSLPSFLVPATQSNSFWYSAVGSVPFIGLVGEFQDFVAPAFPHVSHILYRQRRFLGHREKALPVHQLRMENGSIFADPESVNEAAVNPPEDALPKLGDLIGAPVATLHDEEIGSLTDILLSFKDGFCVVESILVSSSPRLRTQLNKPEFGIPSERLSVKEVQSGWTIVAHVRVAANNE